MVLSHSIVTLTMCAKPPSGAHFHNRALRDIRKCVDAETARTAVCSMVGARTDYCNSILYGTSAANLNKFQRVINTLARAVFGIRKRDHITPVLADLHWLPVAPRIKFKIALQTFKTLLTMLTMDSSLPCISHIASFRQNNMIAWKGRP